MAEALFDVGDLIRSSLVIKVASVLTDPGGLTFQLKDPSNGAVSTFTFGVDGELVKDSTGNYHIDNSIAESGIHQYRWASTGVAQGAEEGSYRVQIQEVK